MAPDDLRLVDVCSVHVVEIPGRFRLHDVNVDQRGIWGNQVGSARRVFVPFSSICSLTVVEWRQPDPDDDLF